MEVHCLQTLYTPVLSRRMRWTATVSSAKRPTGLLKMQCDY